MTAGGWQGQDHHHGVDDPHDHPDEEPSEDSESRVDEAIWAVDNVELTTVGIDIGSATSHLMFSHLHLRRRAEGYSSRFVVVERRPLYRSSVMAASMPRRWRHTSRRRTEGRAWRGTKSMPGP
jgi:ethanolamine utilization protein EutA